MSALRRRLGEAARSTNECATRALDLEPDGTLYPLGWHLSPRAVDGLWRSSAGLLATTEFATRDCQR